MVIALLFMVWLPYDLFSHPATTSGAASGKNIVPIGTITGTINSGEYSARLLQAVSDNPAITYDGL
jgi:hypothetical protein